MEMKSLTQKTISRIETFLSKYNLDINDWISGKYDNKLLLKINNDIFNNYHKI